MNDINWRSLDDDESWKLLVAFPDNEVLVETDISFRIDRAKYIEDRPSGPYLSTSCERAIRFTFFE